VLRVCGCSPLFEIELAEIGERFTAKAEAAVNSWGFRNEESRPAIAMGGVMNLLCKGTNAFDLAVRGDLGNTGTGGGGACAPGIPFGEKVIISTLSANDTDFLLGLLMVFATTGKEMVSSSSSDPSLHSLGVSSSLSDPSLHSLGAHEAQFKRNFGTGNTSGFGAQAGAKPLRTKELLCT